MPENAAELLERPADLPAETEMTDVETGQVESGEVVAADLLVEEISIDGMCGVY
jgi:mycofactocin precursor